MQVGVFFTVYIERVVIFKEKEVNGHVVTGYQ